MGRRPDLTPAHPPNCEHSVRIANTFLAISGGVGASVTVMADTPEESVPGDEVSLRIDAPATRIYELVTDVANMGRLSPECTGGTWLDGATGPAVGARFKGRNKRGVARWSTVNKVVTAEPDRAFGFETQQSGMRWTYRFESDGDGTLVTESREAWRNPPLIARLFSRVALGGVDSHDDEMRTGMLATLQRLKEVAERSE